MNIRVIRGKAVGVNFSECVQERQQIVDLLIVQHQVERRHVAAAHLNGLAHVLVSGGHPAGQVVLAEDPDQRRALQRLFFVSVMAKLTVGLKDHASTVLGGSKGALLARAAGLAPNANKQNKSCQEKWEQASQSPIIDVRSFSGKTQSQKKQAQS